MRDRSRITTSAGRLADVLFVGVALLGLGAAMVRLQAQEPQARISPRCQVTGTISAGPTKLPGVVVSVTQGETLVATSSTGVDGRFAVALPGPGTFTLKAELAAFAPVVREFTPGDACQAALDLSLTLKSRVAASAPATAAKPVPSASVPQQAATQPTNAGGGRGGAMTGTAQSRRPAGQFQRVNPTADAAARAGESGSGTDDAQAIAAHLSLPPGFSAESVSESVMAFGSSGQTNEMVLFSPDRMGDLMRPDGMPGMPGEGQALGAGGQVGEGGGRGGRGDGAFGGGFGGAGGGFGGPGGGGPGGGRGGGMGPMGGMGDRIGLGRMQNDRPHGQLSYTLGGSALDAAPYSLTGQPVSKPDYWQQRVAASIGGRLKIPGLFDAGPRTTFFLNYSGNHSTNAYNAYSTVPSLALRSGDFSSLAASVIDPITGLPFSGNKIPTWRISPAAQALLGYIPLPNQLGDTQNYYYSTTNHTSSDDINLRLIRTFGTQQQQRRGGFGGGPMGGGRGGPMGGGRGGTNLNIGIHYTRSTSTQSTPFPTVFGTTERRAWDIPIGLSFTKGGMMHQLRVDFNRSKSGTTNNFAYSANASGDAGLLGVAGDPFDWGVPTLSFSSLSGLRDITPSSRVDQTITLGDTIVKTKGRHAIRFGGDFRTTRSDSRTDASARGSFVFTGLYTGGGSARASGLDFADFLLGLPQQASIQYGPGLERFRSNAWNLFVQDDWRISNRFTVNAGLRYEYQSPYWATNNHLMNLDVSPLFTSATAVQAGGYGLFEGEIPNTIVHPDRNNLSPRIGVAWKPQQKTVVRGGYGINYASVPYLSIIQRLAAQPPFATSDTRIGTTASPLNMATVFTTASTSTTSNNYGVDPNYRLGYVQMWNADVQHEIGRTLSAGISYIGTKGSNLDIQRAPNRGPSGLRIAGVQPFIWESSEGHSIMHALSLRLRQRQSHGVSMSAVYTYSKSMDNASTIGGGSAVVAQNDQDLAAEWGPSSFDQRHRFTGDFTWELPFGPNRHWLSSGKGLGAALLGGWMLNGNLTMSSGLPFTARVVGDVTDVARGVNGTLRADYTGLPITVSSPTIAQFFNTAAFVAPAAGTFGNAGRNTIRGPANANLNVSLMRNITLRGTRGLSLRVQANNVLNRVEYAAIDTVVNSPTFGRVTSVRPMRSVQVIARVMF